LHKIPERPCTLAGGIG